MIFQVPKIFENCDDLNAIYNVNDVTSDELYSNISTLEKDMLLDSMTEQMCEKYEKMLEMVVNIDTPLAQRKIAVKSKIMERLPYSYKALINKLDALLNTTNGEGYQLFVHTEEENVELFVALKLKDYASQIDELMENIVPLNMTIDVEVLFNTYQILNGFTISDLAAFTYKELRETEFWLKITA